MILGVVLFGLLLFPGTRRLAAVLWVGFNCLLVARAGLWVLVHPGRGWQERGIIGRWAFWPALLGTLLLRSNLEPILAEVTGQWLPSSIIYALSLLLFLPFLLAATLLWSSAGAVLGAHGARQEASGNKSTRLGVRTWWGVTLVAGLAATALYRLNAPTEWLSACLGAVPAGALALQRLARGWGERTLAQRLDGWLAHWFVGRSKSSRRIDLRGEILALVGFLIAGAFASLKLLMPLQASALLSGIQLLNAVNPGRIQLQDLEEPFQGGTHRSELPGYGVRMEPARTSGQIVLLEWDAPSLYQATTTNSEPGVHAALIRELAGLGARRLVLPTPVLETTTFATPEVRPIPAPRPGDAARGRTDLASLAAAMRQADNVILLTPGRTVFEFDLTVADPPAGAGQESFRVLQSAAREVGSARVAPIQIAALPALPLRRLRNEHPSAAVTLAAALRQSTNLEANFTGSHTVVVLGRNYPVLDSEQGRLLIDFVTATRGRDFARVPYSSVLRREPLFDANAGEKGSWLPPAEYFRDKLVFLQPLRSMSLASPWGAMEPMEMLAYGVRTLLGGYFIHPVPPVLQTLWALTCALAVGRLVARRNPIKASWRLLMVALIAFALSLILFLNGTWLDPVFPCAAASIAFLLVTQLTFSLERAAKDRNRFLLDRFVAPEVVTELLEPIETNLGLGGRRERVAVLFADVRGFTQFAEGHSPEEVMNVVNAYLHVMTEALHLHGGILDKYTGDGLMALFRMERGVTVAQAVRGALAMRDSVLALSADRTVGGDKSLQVGISLHVGDAVVGLVGNPERQVNFTALGHTVVVAARLQTQAAGGEVVVSQEVYEDAGPGFDMTPRPAVLVKGISLPVVPYLVQRESSRPPVES